jgi:hypothetical protein
MSSDTAVHCLSAYDLGQNMNAGMRLHGMAEAFTLNSTVVQFVPVGGLRHWPLPADNLQQDKKQFRNDECLEVGRKLTG